ncbi:MAG: hypothetical protein ACD_37C00414G0002 [uncultured bacterium]|nr:MAG: hypothetical protein ACD_37C00414G0002 [uncultured bacterium]HLD73525.1 hypothetical protein [Bdellovibrionota bacterium]
MECPTFEYSAEKNSRLLEERGLGFEDIIAILNARGALAVIDHPNKIKYPNQKIYIVDISGYAYLVPFEREHSKVFLKTIFPSRKMTKFYRDKLLGGDKL